MAKADRDLILPAVPAANLNEHPDTFLEALSIAASYGNDELPKRFRFEGSQTVRMGVYAYLSGYTGRGWLIGFDDACYYGEKHGVRNPISSFAAASLESNLEHHETMRDAVTYLGYAPEFLWNAECRYEVDAELAAPFVGTAETVDRSAIRGYVSDYLAEFRRPLVCFLRSRHLPAVEVALLTGFESDGEVVVGSSLCYDRTETTDNSTEHGRFRMADWERDVVAIVGLGEKTPIPSAVHPCYTAIENALRYSKSYTRGTKHYGLSAYDAWECALLDDESVTGADDRVVSRRLLYHSSVAGFVACQKAFTIIPDWWHSVPPIPSMGVVSGLYQRAGLGPLVIHGLMWDVWHVVGAYWKSMAPGDEEVRRFKDRAVRERAAEIIRRARRTDEQAIAELREAKEEWDRCRGRGSTHPCPCFDKPCTRV